MTRLAPDAPPTVNTISSARTFVFAAWVVTADAASVRIEMTRDCARLRTDDAATETPDVHSSAVRTVRDDETCEKDAMLPRADTPDVDQISPFASSVP